MEQHPLHYLFLAAHTAIARDAWREAIAYARQALASSQGSLSTQRLIEALERIERWEMPESGKFWSNVDGTPSDRPMSYGAAFGSNGERDIIRGIARRALAALTQGTEPLSKSDAGATHEEE